MTAPTSATLRTADPAVDRPTTPAPIYHQIPAELLERPQWVVWRWMRNKDGKWTKPPYNARTGKSASTTAPRTWSTFEQAKQTYLDNPVGWAGIGYVFTNDDPYVGIDLDHCRDAATGAITAWAQVWLDRFPTYAEISPSQTGIKLIIRGRYPAAKGIKTPPGEMYAHERYFTITGACLAGHTAIGEAQAAIDDLYAELKKTDIRNINITPEVGMTDGERATQATSHPDSEWDEARRLMQTNRGRLIARATRAAGKSTQLAYVLSGDFAGFHTRWPFVGIYRGDGEVDASMVRAVVARGLRGRGFTFPEFVVIMSEFFARYCIEKWRSKHAWRAELERLWELAPAPARAFARRARRQSPDMIKKPVGRACNHKATLERVFGAIYDRRAGVRAIIRIDELAQELGAHRRTISTALKELSGAGRITTQRFGQYGGLIVTFVDMIVSPSPAEDQKATMQETEQPAVPHEAAGVFSDVLVTSPPTPDQGVTVQETALPAIPHEETLNPVICVSSSFSADDHVSPKQRAPDIDIAASSHATGLPNDPPPPVPQPAPALALWPPPGFPAGYHVGRSGARWRLSWPDGTVEWHTNRAAAIAAAKRAAASDTPLALNTSSTARQVQPIELAADHFALPAAPLANVTVSDETHTVVATPRGAQRSLAPSS